ncbi:hypothetical protein ACFU9B_44285 [Streptomyces sp. NPDC057592]|uniref:hypothetical protein n=1 Tax=unclassified Streptomyces TaxID=2593676 RepID=UPI0036B79E33
MFAMAVVDLSTIDESVRGEVAVRGLYLVSVDEHPGPPRVFVCTDPDPDDIGFTVRGHVTPSVSWYHVYGMNGLLRMGAPDIDVIHGMFPSWEAGIMAVLEAFDRYSESTHY